MRKLAGVLLAAACTLPTIALAESAVVVKGKCEHLQIGAENLTRDCNPTMENRMFDTGRVDFIFTFGREGLVTIMGEPFAGKERTADRIEINTVLYYLAKEGVSTAETLATGKCTISRPKKKPRMKLRCAGKFFDGTKFSANFSA